MPIGASRTLTSITMSLGLTALALFANGMHVSLQTVSSPPVQMTALDLIKSQKYNEAITQLEQILEREPGNSEALTYIATANLYRTRDFFKAQTEFKEAFKAGGGATFFVTYSHEM